MCVCVCVYEQNPTVDQRSCAHPSAKPESAVSPYACQRRTTMDNHNKIFTVSTNTGVLIIKLQHSKGHWDIILKLTSQCSWVILISGPLAAQYGQNRRGPSHTHTHTHVPINTHISCFSCSLCRFSRQTPTQPLMSEKGCSDHCKGLFAFINCPLRRNKTFTCFQENVSCVCLCKVVARVFWVVTRVLIGGF